MRLWAKKQRADCKAIVLEMYGHKCMECGFSNPLALQLDHIIEIRRNTSSNFGDAGSALWYKVAKGLLPKSDFRLLCANCHSIKTYKALYSN